MKEHTWTVGGYKYRAGKPQTLGSLAAGNNPIIQRLVPMSSQWETIASDPAVAKEMLRLAELASKAPGKR